MDPQVDTDNLRISSTQHWRARYVKNIGSGSVFPHLMFRVIVFGLSVFVLAASGVPRSLAVAATVIGFTLFEVTRFIRRSKRLSESNRQAAENYAELHALEEQMTRIEIEKARAAGAFDRWKT